MSTLVVTVPLLILSIILKFNKKLNKSDREAYIGLAGLVSVVVLALISWKTLFITVPFFIWVCGVFVDSKTDGNLSSDEKQSDQKYVNEDMKRIKQMLDCIPPKIKELMDFNSQLFNTIIVCKGKANAIIEEAYKSVGVFDKHNITNEVINKLEEEGYKWKGVWDYFWFENFEKISQQYSLKINPHLAMACDASVKKIVAIITQKQDIVSKNNADIDKYNQMCQKLQQQYDDELALQKNKELNKDINSEMEDVSDIANKEIKNSEIQSIISEIDLLDKEVNERRNYEIQFGQIEI